MKLCLNGHFKGGLNHSFSYLIYNTIGTVTFTTILNGNVHVLIVICYNHHQASDHILSLDEKSCELRKPNLKCHNKASQGKCWV